MASKYVAGRLKSGSLAAIISSDLIEHTSLADLFSEVSSAGFVSIGIIKSEYGNPCVSASIYGKSISLKIESDQNDIWLINKALNIQE